MDLIKINLLKHFQWHLKRESNRSTLNDLVLVDAQKEYEFMILLARFLYINEEWKFYLRSDRKHAFKVNFLLDQKIRVFLYQDQVSIFRPFCGARIH